MIRDHGYNGSIVQLRRIVTSLRPNVRGAYLRLQIFPGVQVQADWAHFGHVMVGRARRALSCFVMTLSYSRRPLSGVLLRSDDGKLSPRSRPCVSVMAWPASGNSL